MERRGFMQFLGGFLCSLPFWGKRVNGASTDLINKTKADIEKGCGDRSWISRDGIHWQHLDGVTRRKNGLYEVNVPMNFVKNHPTFYCQIGNSVNKITHHYQGGDLLRLRVLVN